MATGGDGAGGSLTWDAPGDDPGITRHEYRYNRHDGRHVSGGVDAGPRQRGGSRDERGQSHGDRPESRAGEHRSHGGGGGHRHGRRHHGLLRDHRRRTRISSRTSRATSADREDDRGGRADELHGDGRRRAGPAVVGRAGDGFGRDETPVPAEDDGELRARGRTSRTARRTERTITGYEVTVQGQRHGLHLRVARGEGRHQQRSSRGGSGDADGHDHPDLHAEPRRRGEDAAMAPRPAR